MQLHTRTTIWRAVPVITGSNPASPGMAETPDIEGMAETDSTIHFYPTVNCSGPQLPGGAATGGTFSIPFTVTSNTITNITATATDPADNISACSNSFAYTHDDTVPAAPIITGSTPTSPSGVLTPDIIGTAETNSTIDLYPTDDCTGPQLPRRARNGRNILAPIYGNAEYDH